MLSWFSRKLCWLKQRLKSKQTTHQTSTEQTKWHKACLWLAHSVGGIDMLLRDDGSIKVISKSSLDPETMFDCLISRSQSGSIRCHLHVNLLSETECQKSVFKTIECWSEPLAKFVVNLISLPGDSDPNSSPLRGRWGIMVPAPADGDGLVVKSEVLFPTFKSEEELLMRMALAGFDVNNDKDSADA